MILALCKAHAGKVVQVGSILSGTPGTGFLNFSVAWRKGKWSNLNQYTRTPKKIHACTEYLY